MNAIVQVEFELAYYDVEVHHVIQYTSETPPGDLRRFDVTQTWVKDNQLTLVWKTSKKSNNNNRYIDTSSDKLKKLLSWDE